METVIGYLRDIEEPEEEEDEILYFTIIYGLGAAIFENGFLARQKNLWCQREMVDKVKGYYKSRWNAIYDELRVEVAYTKGDNQAHDISFIL